jgi:hypothetical protein
MVTIVTEVQVKAGSAPQWDGAHARAVVAGEETRRVGRRAADATRERPRSAR